MNLKLIVTILRPGKRSLVGTCEVAQFPEECCTQADDTVGICVDEERMSAAIAKLFLSQNEVTACVLSLANGQTVHISLVHP